MYEQSHRDYLRSGYRHHRHLSWAVNHYRDNAITYKAQRQKCQRTEAGGSGSTDLNASACCCARCKIHRSYALIYKAENDALRDDVAAGRRRLHQKQSVSQCVKPPPPPA